MIYVAMAESFCRDIPQMTRARHASRFPAPPRHEGDRAFQFMHGPGAGARLQGALVSVAASSRMGENKGT
jgi:hypothetical protein